MLVAKLKQARFVKITLWEGVRDKWKNYQLNSDSQNKQSPDPWVFFFLRGEGDRVRGGGGGEAIIMARNSSGRTRRSIAITSVYFVGGHGGGGGGFVFRPQMIISPGVRL